MSAHSFRMDHFPWREGEDSRAGGSRGSDEGGNPKAGAAVQLKFEKGQTKR